VKAHLLDIQAQLREQQGAPVPLAVAASLVYFQLRRISWASNAAELDRSLNDACHALAQIADVYYENGDGHILRIPDAELHRGAFEKGGRAFTVDGRVFQGLSMRRIDVMYAMEMLEKGRQELAGEAVAPKTSDGADGSSGS
jgi:hypothetical protein